MSEAARARPRLPGPRTERLVLTGAAALAALALLGAGRLSTVRGWAGLAGVVALASWAVARHAEGGARVRGAPLAQGGALAVLLLGPLALVRTEELFDAPARAAWLALPLAALLARLAWGRRAALEVALAAAALLALRRALPDAGAPPAELATLDGRLWVALGGGLAAALVRAPRGGRPAPLRRGLAVGAVQAALVLALACAELAGPQGATLGGSSAAAAAALAAGLLASLLAAGLEPAVEPLLGVVGAATLIELGDVHAAPLLRRLRLEAPGTFRHSWAVAQAAEAAAVEIGADARLARAGGLYHDVGKLGRPELYDENDAGPARGGRDPAPELDALLLAAHASDGVELARAHGLPPALVAIVREHHGTTRVERPWRRALEDRGRGAVREADYRHAGPRPTSRESALVMLADAAEAIARRLGRGRDGASRLSGAVHAMIQERAADGQLDDCGLTLGELARAEAALLRVLGALDTPREPTERGPGLPERELPRPAVAGTPAPAGAPAGAEPTAARPLVGVPPAGARP